MPKVILYTTGCPKCIVLKKKLDSKNIEYDICDSIEKMLDLKIMTAPVLSVDGKLLTFREAVDWVQAF